MKTLAAIIAAAAIITTVPAHQAQATTSSWWCFHVYSPYTAYRETAPNPCATRGFALIKVADSTNEVIIVTALVRSATYARFNAFARSGSSWAHRYGPWIARIGSSGFALPGQKIEGDDRTPQGTYGFSFMFGVYPNPGVKFPWRHAYTYDYWDDDPASARYNLWTDTRYYWAGRNPEPLHQVPAYEYAAVIAYNIARTPGLGSAIFLHMGDGNATAGCVSLPAAELLTILRWLSPATYPTITMKVL